MGLTRKECKVMRAVLNACDGKSSCLVSPDALLESILLQGRGEKTEKAEKEEHVDFTMADLKKIIKVLELDDYFEVVESEKRGDTVYCINLHSKGEGFERSRAQTRRYLYFKLAVTVGFALLSFIIGRILVAIFT